MSGVHLVLLGLRSPGPFLGEDAARGGKAEYPDLLPYNSLVYSYTNIGGLALVDLRADCFAW
jgi:hypothetical protein